MKPLTPSWVDAGETLGFPVDPLILAALIAVVIVIVLAVLLMRRKKKPPEVQKPET